MSRTRLPAKARVVELLDLLDAFHEPREILELRPLVVRGSQWNLYLDPVLYQ
jgi:hypothetical protein